AARRLQPGLCQRVMEDVGLRAVGVAAEQTFPVDQTESCERGMGSKPMLEHDDLVGLETGRHDRVEHILIAEVERIGEPPVSVPGSVNVELANALVQQLKQLMAERIGNDELPCIQIRLPASRPEGKRRAPLRKEPVVVRLVVHERDQSTTSCSL